MVNNMPQCVRCFGKDWIDLGTCRDMEADPTLHERQREHFYQCGGGLAHTDAYDMKQGCMRVIRATPEEMTKGGSI